MTTESIRALHQAQPFMAFDIHLADGRAIRVNHPEFLVRGGRTIVVYEDPEIGETVDLLLVTSLKPVKTAGLMRNGH